MSLGAHVAAVKGIAFSRDGTKVATAALDEIRVWKVSRPQICPNGSCPPGELKGAEKQDSRSIHPVSPAAAGATRRQAEPERIADPKTSKPRGWPALVGLPSGGHEVRIRNPNTFSVLVGVRSQGRGADFEVAPAGVDSVYVPDGQYDIYFNYANQPDAVYQGDSFAIRGNGVEIRIVQVMDGNYGIRRVR